MLLILKRYHRNETTYDGRIYIRGQFVCDTVEHCRSALPVGTYLLVKGVCKAHMKQVFFIQPPLPKLCEGCMMETSESLNQRLFCPCSMLLQYCYQFDQPSYLHSCVLCSSDQECHRQTSLRQ